MVYGDIRQRKLRFSRGASLSPEKGHFMVQ
jgi:hypothetical protein